MSILDICRSSGDISLSAYYTDCVEDSCAGGNCDDVISKCYKFCLLYVLMLYSVVFIYFLLTPVLMVTFSGDSDQLCSTMESLKDACDEKGHEISPTYRYDTNCSMYINIKYTVLL